jgi:small conductance mechanosensitive channel
MDYFEQFMSRHQWISQSLVNFADRLFRVALIIAFVIVCTKLIPVVIREIKRLVSQRFIEDGEVAELRGKDRDKRLTTVLNLVATTLRVGLFVTAFLMVLRELGLDITPLLTGAGIAGVAIGFGAQSLVKDVISGVFLLIEDQIRLGDVIRINNGLSGAVERMELRVTAIRDADGTLHIIPNGEIKAVSNMTYDFGRAVVDIPVQPKADVEMVRKLLADVLVAFGADAKWKPELRSEPKVIGISNFQVGAVIFQVSVETEPASRWAVSAELRRRIKRALDEAGIALAGP